MACRSILLGSIVAAGFALAAESAHANSVFIGATVERVGTGGGGPFEISGFDDRILPVSTDIMNVDNTTYDNRTFNTFCLEKSEHISLPGGPYGYTIDSKAYNGGIGGGNPDPLSDATAKLYYAYWTGQLDNFSVTSPSAMFTFKYTAGGDHGTDGGALQEAIWRLEDESTSVGGKAGTLTSFANAVTWAQLGQSSWQGIGLVRVVNLTSGLTGGTPLQSQLVVIVPLPAAALMGFALLGALGIAKRVRARRNSTV